MAAFLLALSFLSMQLRAAFAEDAFAVTAPKAGDTISVGKSTTSDVEVPISWTVPDAIAERPVLISLVQGNNLSSLSRVEQINCAYNPNPDSVTSTPTKLDQDAERGIIFSQRTQLRLLHVARRRLQQRARLQLRLRRAFGVQLLDRAEGLDGCCLLGLFYHDQRAGWRVEL